MIRVRELFAFRGNIMLSLSTSGMSGSVMDLRRVSHSCISSWWRVTQMPVLCESVGSPLTPISAPLFLACSYLSQPENAAAPTVQSQGSPAWGRHKPWLISRMRAVMKKSKSWGSARPGGAVHLSVVRNTANVQLGVCQ